MERCRGRGRRGAVGTKIQVILGVGPAERKAANNTCDGYRLWTRERRDHSEEITGRLVNFTRQEVQRQFEARDVQRKQQPDQSSLLAGGLIFVCWT